MISSGKSLVLATRLALIAVALVAVFGRIATSVGPLVTLGSSAEEGLPAAFVVWLALRLRFAEGFFHELRHRLVDVVIAAALLGTLGDSDLALSLVMIHFALSMLAAPLAATRLRDTMTMAQNKLRPARLLVNSFLAIILLGTLLLTLPAAATSGESTSVVDALFTATSATCVTGLNVVDPSKHFTMFGQVVIVCLIQIGGLGIMTISAASVFLLGHRVGMRSKLVMLDVLDSTDIEDLRRLMVAIVRGTLLIELAGSAVLAVRFIWLGYHPIEAAWLGIFHGVSAFCNAGFALFSDNLVSLKADLTVVGCISALIILGGLGFGVLSEVASPRRWRSGSFSLHTRIVLTTTTFLLAAGTIFFYFSEPDASMRGFTPEERLLSAWFCAVTPRTAGFNTVPMSALSQAGILFTLVLMFIGGSPGSTAGGIKTSTFAVMVLSVKHLIANRPQVVLGRTLPRSIIDKAFAIAFIGAGMIALMACTLCLTEQGTMQQILFETVSAFGTVGLSLDYTPNLSIPGRLLISLMMFVGRVGPLTLALALGEATAGRVTLQYPEGRVLVG